MKIFVVADPLFNFDGMIIDNVASRFLFENVIDFDYSSLYPSVIIGQNIDGTTQIGKIEFIDDMGISSITQLPIDGSDFCGHLVSKDFMNIGKTYFNIPLPSEITKSIKNGEYDDIMEEVT